ncbi:type III secretion system stator protein SctL [Klebsiella indica]|uniref:HrpE/YscL family type III secretion apparatus protein n=1 Tax=Klebsiella indica TaxID=2582917 RepID=A0A5R9LDM4_9ENTR|nr:type III secretion system stator protein SctL [Klebsiella indica]TLV11635.1 HrpE/YscL family type III secretion apparatus protein [Klebsiella indica]
MLTQKRITLLNGDTDLAPIITRAQLRLQQQGQTLLVQAQQQAQALLMTAEQEREQQREAVRQQVERDFWQQADAMLHALQQQYQQLESQALVVMEVVVSQAIGQLLEQVPEHARMTALLRQLLRAQTVDAQGELYCHPDQRQVVADWLASQPHLCWRLQTDNALPIDKLKLTTTQGELHLDWRQAVQRLLPVCGDETADPPT